MNVKKWKKTTTEQTEFLFYSFPYFLEWDIGEAQSEC